MGNIMRCAAVWFCGVFSVYAQTASFSDASAKTALSVSSTTNWLAQWMDQYHKAFYVYDDSDSAGNHFAARGRLGDGTNALPMIEACTDGPHSGTTCIKAQFSAGENWGGWYFMNGILKTGETAPAENWGTYTNAGVSLAGTPRLRFWARGASGGEKVEFFVAGIGRDGDTGAATTRYPDSSAKVSTGYITLGTSWKEYVIDLTKNDMSYVLGGFGWVTASNKNKGKGIVFYLDDIRYEQSRLTEPHFMLSYLTLAPTNGFDRVTRNVAYTYDNAVAAIAFLAAGDTNRAATIADAFVYALAHDREYSDGRLRNAYQAGDLMVPPGWLSNGKTGTVRLPGWSDPATGGWLEDLDQMGITAGNQAWAILAMLNCYQATGKPDYLEAAKEMGNWLENACYTNNGAGGYTFGFGKKGAALTSLTYKSTEHAIDLYAAFSWLHRLTPGDTVWSNRADHALLFVKAMYDADNHRFWTGTGEDGVTVNTNVYALDCQVWPLLALGPEGTAYIPSLDYAAAHMKSGQGFAFSEGHTNGVWMEGTAFTALTYGSIGNATARKAIVSFLASRREDSGAFYATDQDPSLATGIDLSDGSPWVYYHRVHAVPAAWFVLAAQSLNPYTGCIEQALPDVCTVGFDARGGTVSPASMTVTNGFVYGELPVPTRDGYAFAGWWTGENGTGNQVTSTTVADSLADCTLFAKWTMIYTGTVGMAFNASLPDAFENAEKVTVKGLPVGLKFDAASGMIVGVPTQTGTYTVTISALGIATQTQTITVEALPAWAQGAFNGYAGGGGLASMSVTAAGKITGKITVGGTNYTFAASSYTRYDDYVGAYWIETQAKSSKAVMPLEISVCQPVGLDVWLGYYVPENVAAAESENAWLLNGREDGVPLLMWRDVWKEAPDVLALFSGYYTATLPGNSEYGSGYLTLTVDKAGKVKVGGKLADGTAVSMSGVLLINGSGSVYTALYAAPAAYKGGMLYGPVGFVKPFDGEVYLYNSGPVRWESRTPLATETYGAGFARETGLSGGRYGSLASLGTYYAGLDLTVGTATNAAAPELTVGTVRYDSVWWNPTGIALTPSLKAGSLAGLTAPAAGKPTDVDKDGVWDYSATNSAGLKIALTPATGIFKGSFLAWFDYAGKHTSKKMAFEGALTPVREDPDDGIEGRGYFLWADKAVIPTTGKTYSFSWSYDFLISGTAD